MKLILAAICVLAVGHCAEARGQIKQNDLMGCVAIQSPAPPTGPGK